MTTLSVEEAEAQLSAARANVERQKCENAKQEIERLRREGAAIKKRLPSLEAQVAQAQQERLNLHEPLLTALAQIATYSKPLDPFSFPTDEEIAEHAQQLVLWQERHRELLAKAADASRREAAQDEAIAQKNRLVGLECQIRNLTAVAAGRKTGEI